MRRCAVIVCVLLASCASSSVEPMFPVASSLSKKENSGDELARVQKCLLATQVITLGQKKYGIGSSDSEYVVLADKIEPSLDGRLRALSKNNAELKANADKIYESLGVFVISETTRPKFTRDAQAVLSDCAELVSVKGL